jgi:uncharacterized membrane protein YdjX (TVP38/TMEM64 family)
MNARDARVRVLAKGLALVAILLALAMAIEATGVADRFGRDFIDDTVRGQGLAGELIFVVVAAAAMSVGLPRQVPSFFGGYAFGLGLGVALALVATVLGAIVSFFSARFLSRHVFGVGDARTLGRLGAFLSRETFRAAILLRLLPVGHNLGTNIAAGISGVRLGPFLAGSALGYLPQTAIFALMGSGVTVAPTARVVIGVVLFVASSLIGVHLALRYRALASDDGVPEPEDGRGGSD